MRRARAADFHDDGHGMRAAAEQRCTPAMPLGATATDQIWTIGELEAAALEANAPPPLPRPTPDTALRPVTLRFR